jgi:hypothetical protein
MCFIIVYEDELLDKYLFTAYFTIKRLFGNQYYPFPQKRQTKLG